MRRPTDQLAVELLASFGKSLRHDRRFAERFQKDVSALAAITMKQVVSLETGKAADAKISTLTRLARAVGGDPIEMMSRFKTVPAEPE